ncbi:hypothetical protein Tco_1471298, partial [Tanacetum coccineum]
IRVLETFSNSLHWWRKSKNVIPCSVAWSNGLKFEKSSDDRLFYSKNSSFNKLTPLEVRHEVRVRTKVSRVVDKEEVHVRAVDKEDVRTRAVDEEDIRERAPVEGVSQCTILNDEYESVAVDGLISLRSQDVGHISKNEEARDDPEFKVKKNEEASQSDIFLSTQQVRAN